MNQIERTLTGLSGDVAAIELTPEAVNHDAEPTLALHGWLDNAASFLPLAEQLTSQSLLAMDFPGHGLSSPRPPGCVYHLMDYVADVNLVTEAAGWPAYNLIGHSLGAGIACLQAAAMPEKIKRLVLIDGMGPLSALPEKAPEQLQKALLAQVRSNPGDHSGSVKGYPSWQHLVSTRQRASQISESSANLLMRRAAYEEAGEIFVRSDRRLKSPSSMYLSEAQVEAFIGSISCPVLLIQASEGIIAKHENLAARVNLFADIQVETIQGGHHLHMDDPAPVARLISDFLDRPDGI